MEETFKEVDEVIDEFIKSGRCSMVTRPDNKKQVLFSPVEHLLYPLVCERASDAMRNLWHGNDMLEPEKVSPYRDDLVVPKGRDLEELLLRRKVRTADQLDRRKQRHKAAAKEKQEEQEEAAQGKRKTVEAALLERRDLALADPDHYERYLTSARDRAWWKNEGRLRAEAAREAREGPPGQGAKTSWATLDWRPPSNAQTEEI